MSYFTTFNEQRYNKLLLSMDLEQETSSDEEILVFAEFKDTVNIDNYRSIHVLGINDKNPILQMDETIFTGQLENPLGTFMFFTKDLNPECSDQLFDKLPKESVKYLCKATKYLNMNHTYITPKHGAEQGASNHLQLPENEPVPITFNTVQEAIEKFKIEWESKLHETKRDLVMDNMLSDQEMIDLDRNT